MKKTLLISLVLLLSGSFIIAQNYLNHSVKWLEIKSTNDGGGVSHSYKRVISIIGDTIINGINYYNVMGSKRVANTFIPDANGVTVITSILPGGLLDPIREQGGIFYRYRQSLDIEQELHDFNLMVGDTVSEYCTDTVFEIDEYPLLGNEVRKVFYQAESEETKVYEGIGSVQGLYRSTCANGPEDENFIYCFTKDNEYADIYYNTSIDCNNFDVWFQEEVEQILLSEEDIKKNVEFYVQPNPFKNEIEIAFGTSGSFATLRVFSINGKEVLKQDFPTPNEKESVNLSSLPVGFYIFYIENEEFSKAFKLLKTN